MLLDTFSPFDRLGRDLFSVVDQPMVAPVDIHRDGNRYVFDADLPGVDPGSVDVTVEGDSLTIRAERSRSPRPPGAARSPWPWAQGSMQP